MAKESETYILFELAGGTYAIPSASVEHIEMLEHVTMVPNAHRAIEGVVFSRGQLLPALNLRVRFGFPRQEKSLKTRVIFTRIGDRVVGLVVDSSREFKRIPASAIRPIEQTLAGVAGNYLTGITSIGERLVLIINLENLLDLDNDVSLANSLSEIISRASAEKLSEAQTA